MKWMLIILVFGSSPVKTDLVFNSLADCLSFEEAVRAEHVKAFNDWETWAKRNVETANYPDSQPFQEHRIGLRNQATCIPHAQGQLTIAPPP